LHLRRQATAQSKSIQLRKLASSAPNETPTRKISLK
jgi:hypothetical protein